jgi:putative transposase
VGHNRVARLMQEYGLGARVKRAFRLTTKSNHGLPVEQNMLGRQFAVAAANRVWVSDISYVPTAEGWLYLCVILDLYSRRVVGWSMGNGLGTNLVIAAFMMAVLRRQPHRRLVFHSDRGVQYCAKAFRRRTRAWGMQQSMSRKGDCWDNACAESFFKSLKTELIGRQIFATREGARSAIFEYIEVFYNRQRLHSYLDYCTPAEFEEGSGARVA